MTDIVKIGDATLYHGDCMDILPTLGKVDAVVTDPPYPNNQGHFDEDVVIARDFLLLNIADTILWFWTERELPDAVLPLVAVHIWHRTNVNGRIYEPIHHYCRDGKHKRSVIIPHAAVFNGVGPGCNEYEGHPTQKPIALMKRLIHMAIAGVVLDPFMGSGTTGVACAHTHTFIGIEKEKKYFDIACERIEAAYAQGRLTL